MTRDWLLGAPETDPGTSAPPVAPSERPAAPAGPESDDWSTETFDRPTDFGAAPAEPTEDDDATTMLGAVPDSDDDRDGPGEPPTGPEPPAGEGRGP